MRAKDLMTVAVTGLGVLSGAMLVYGALVESKRLVVDQETLMLKGWPARLAGFKIAVLGDFHLRDRYSMELAQKAVAAALEESPDMVVLVGDIVGHWKLDSPWMIGEVLEPLLLMNGNVVSIAGNHDYQNGSADLLAPILDMLNIKFLRNESWTHAGITWVGVDSHNAGQDDVFKALEHAGPEPRICLWHEPDLVDSLPTGACVLQLSGHSHGGQFIFPGGLVPMTSSNGKKYRDGFYPDAPTPIFTTRGVGTTGPPSRFLCPPQVAILTLNPS